MNKKTTARILSLMAGIAILFFQSTAFAVTYPNSGGTGTQWTIDITDTTATGCYTGFDVTDCTAGGGLMYALDTCDVVGNVTVVGSTLAADEAIDVEQVAGGGFWYNCKGTDTTTDYDNWVCRSNPTHVANHVETYCTGAGTSTWATTATNSNQNCFTNYTNCDGANDGTCEVKYLGGSETAYPAKANAIYTAICGATCDATHLSCDGTTAEAADDADGCEITEGVTAHNTSNTVYGTSCAAYVCESGYFLYGDGDAIGTEGCLGTIGESCTVTTGGLPGTCTGAGTTGETVVGTQDCACAEADIPEFSTGGFVDAAGAYTQLPATLSTTNPLLWGQQTGTGMLLQVKDSAYDWDTAFTETASITNGSATFTASATMATLLKPGDTIMLNSDTGEIKIVKSVSGTTVVVTENITTTAGTAAIQKDLPEFEVDITGQITAGFLGSANLTGGDAGYVLAMNDAGTDIVWRTASGLSGAGDNLGDHTATEALQMKGYKIIYGTTGTNGISIADSTGDVTMDGSLLVGTGLTVTTGGIDVNAGASTFAAGVTVESGDLTLTSGDLVLTSGKLNVTGTGSTVTGDLSVTNGLTVTGAATSLTTTTVGGILRVGSNRIVNGGSDTLGIGIATTTGSVTMDGDLTVTDGDLVLGDTDDKGTIALSDGSSNTLTLDTGSIGTNYSLTFPGAQASNGTGQSQVLTASDAGILSWMDVVPDPGCTGDGKVMQWNTTAWTCVDLAAASAQTIDIAYDAGTPNATSRTVTLDGDAIKFDGSHASNDVFQLVNASGTGDVIDIVNEGSGKSIRVNDGTSDLFTVDADGDVTIVATGVPLDINAGKLQVDANGNLTIVSGDSTDALDINTGKFKVDTNGNITITNASGIPITVNTDDFVVDAAGNTILQQLRLIASAADGSGEPTATCDATTKGNIAYVVSSNLGFYYGCKQTGASTYVWVSMEVFGG